MASIFFSSIDVTRQVFFKTPLTYAIVNLKPIVPGHVLVIPRRPVQRLSDLNGNIQRVGSVVERAYGCDALTIACQDGVAAGQSIPHTHFHILPRKAKGDRFSENNDEVYPALDNAEDALPTDLRTATAGVHEPLKVDADEHRSARTMDEMVKEASWLKTFFDSPTDFDDARPSFQR
ncbi:diadenosine 5',5'''-P1,P4-tetraphosphate asymmetrical hydrolase [Fistulina hepatica ATCC 64428]|uniref:Diadenosine 5',5'''-P1,P4-tetraphosphate asymmetrical hydrolase n=1 Tax=Fistulina hepatica ATCC 64428 TaxID=1128425 RepID=A0A0D7A979_9AGAR|nr:diadenosine 5',5'''-P1,P4-tetraphosphate asymmetrical hydrolase [Fistulina hepatica ATCC 64428]